MRPIDEKEHMKDNYYKDISSKMPRVLHIYASIGLKTHVATVLSFVPEFNNMTMESNVSNNRFMFEKL